MKSASEPVAALIIVIALVIAALIVANTVINSSRREAEAGVVSISYAKLVYLTGTTSTTIWHRVEVGVVNSGEEFVGSVCLYTRKSDGEYDRIKCRENLLFRKGFNSISFEIAVSYTELSDADPSYIDPRKWFVVVEKNGKPVASQKPVYIIP